MYGPYDPYYPPGGGALGALGAATNTGTDWKVEAGKGVLDSILDKIGGWFGGGDDFEVADVPPELISAFLSAWAHAPQAARTRLRQLANAANNGIWTSDAKIVQNVGIFIHAALGGKDLKATSATGKPFNLEFLAFMREYSGDPTVDIPGSTPPQAPGTLPDRTGGGSNSPSQPVTQPGRSPFEWFEDAFGYRPPGPVLYGPQTTTAGISPTLLVGAALLLLVMTSRRRR